MIRLEPWQEYVGKLVDLRRESGSIKAKFEKLDTVILPKTLEGRLEKLVGKKISILRTDIPGKDYLVAEHKD